MQMNYRKQRAAARRHVISIEVLEEVQDGARCDLGGFGRPSWRARFAGGCGPAAVRARSP